MSMKKKKVKVERINKCPNVYNNYNIERKNPVDDKPDSGSVQVLGHTSRMHGRLREDRGFREGRLIHTSMSGGVLRLSTALGTGMTLFHRRHISGSTNMRSRSLDIL